MSDSGVVARLGGRVGRGVRPEGGRGAKPSANGVGTVVVASVCGGRQRPTGPSSAARFPARFNEGACRRSRGTVSAKVSPVRPKRWLLLSAASSAFRRAELRWNGRPSRWRCPASAVSVQMWFCRLSAPTGVPVAESLSGGFYSLSGRCAPAGRRTRRHLKRDVGPACR